MAHALSTRRIVALVMLCHFVAAFAALGMPPFFALIIERSLHGEARYLAGWFYVVPTLFLALSSPWWGRVADRRGRKMLLIRAQLGLAASFLLAGFATDVWWFLLALALQGILGGTFAASNAYLATAASGSELTRSLTAMQWSARAALVVAPVGLGVWMEIESPIEIYRYLALLPLAAALLTFWLPDNPAREVAAIASGPASGCAEAKPAQIYILQFTFVFATVATFPYFIPHIQSQFQYLSGMASGFLFGLPHLVYLATAPLLLHWLGTFRPLLIVGAAFIAMIVSFIGQIYSSSLEWLIGWRLVMGIAMTTGFIGLHALIAGVVRIGSAGQTFGWFESGSKWGAVGAGFVAGLAAALAGPAAPMLLGAVALGIATAYVSMIALSRSPLSEP